MYAMTDEKENVPPTDISSVFGNFATADDLLDQDNPILEGWQMFGLATAYEERPPVREIVRGILTEASLNIVFGAPGSLKSMILADMCACIVAGTPWLPAMPGQPLDMEPLTTAQGAVLWVDFDNGRRRTHDRMSAIGRGHNLAPSAPFHYVSMPDPWLNASKRIQLLHLTRLIERNHITAVVFDNLGLIIGDAEENSADMAPVMGNLRWLADTTGAALTLIHHQRKSGPSDDGIRKGETIRGHSSIEASLDFALHVDRKPGDQVLLTPVKTRDAVIFEQAGALFTYQHKPDSNIMDAARFWGYSVDSAASRELAQIKATIKDVVQSTPGVNQGNLVTAVRDRFAGMGARTPGINKVRDAIRQSVESGAIETRKTAKQAAGTQDEILHFVGSASNYGANRNH
jgi:hypothetical protein